MDIDDKEAFFYRRFVVIDNGQYPVIAEHSFLLKLGISLESYPESPVVNGIVQCRKSGKPGCLLPGDQGSADGWGGSTEKNSEKQGRKGKCSCNHISVLLMVLPARKQGVIIIQYRP